MPEKMICSQCGGKMNQHAEKFVYLEDGTSGCIEIHACPACGNSDSRRVGEPSQPKGRL